MHLLQNIQNTYDRLIQILSTIPGSQRLLKILERTGGKISVTDLIAYQIGWGRCLISWYEAGLRKQMPEMPGEGFSQWDYAAIARHFYSGLK